VKTLYLVFITFPWWRW